MNKQGDSWEERLREDVKRKDWALEEWKKSNELIDRTIWYIYRMSPHNLWKAREAIRDLQAQAQSELLEDLLEQGHGGGNWRRIISMKLSQLQKEVKR